jgi:hypothetical protein
VVFTLHFVPDVDAARVFRVSLRRRRDASTHMHLVARAWRVTRRATSECLTFAREWVFIARDGEVAECHVRIRAAFESSKRSHNVRERRGITNNTCRQIAVNERSALRGSP